jgi:hypothetical protein
MRGYTFGGQDGSRMEDCIDTAPAFQLAVRNLNSRQQILTGAGVDRQIIQSPTPTSYRCQWA